MANLKSVYALIFNHFEHGPVVFYVGCTNNVHRRTLEHKRNPFDQKHAEYSTYKYQCCRALAAEGIEYSLEVLAHEQDITDSADEYAWVLKFADYNRAKGIEFYDGYPLTNMKAGDFLSEMISERSIRTPDQIRSYIRRRQQSKTIDYTRENPNNFGNQLRGGATRKNVADSMVMITQQRRTEQVIEDLKKQQREQRRERELAKIRAEQEAEWLRTGQILGQDKK